MPDKVSPAVEVGILITHVEAEAHATLEEDTSEGPEEEYVLAPGPGNGNPS